MITKIVVGLVIILWCIGGYFFIKEMCSCQEGYEDDTGFHVGKDPRE